MNFRIRLNGTQNKAIGFTVAWPSFPIADLSTIIQHYNTALSEYKVTLSG